MLSTLGAQQRRWLRGRRPRQASPAAAPVLTARATLVAAQSFADRDAAERWLRDLRTHREQADAQTRDALAVLNRVLHLHRVASADPFAREVALADALVVRAGIGEGQQVAEGRWLRAIELPTTRGRARREAALRPQERLAALLSTRDAALACEELVLRARQDVDAGRRREAGLQLDVALTAALAELEPWATRSDLAMRLDELRGLQPEVAAAAQTALRGGVDDEHEATVRHALERLEAALRARTAPGFD